MYCKNCGIEIPSDSLFCPNCGIKITEAEPLIVKKKKKNIPIVLSICLIVALVLGSILIVNAIGKAKLQKQLLKDWSRVESDNGTYYSLVLDFSEDEIAYKFESGYWLANSTIAKYKYRVISPNTIEIARSGNNYTTKISIEFNDEGTMLTMTPALTSADSSENWFNH